MSNPTSGQNPVNPQVAALAAMSPEKLAELLALLQAAMAVQAQTTTPVAATVPSTPQPVANTATVPVATTTQAQTNTPPVVAANPAATVPSTPQPAPPKKHDPTVWRWYHSVTVGVIVFFLTIISVFLLGSSKVSDSNRVPEPTEKDIAQEKGKPSDDKEMAQQAIEKSRAARLSKDVARMRQALAGLKFLDDAKFRTSEFAPAFYERGMLHELIGNSAEARKDFSLIGKLK